MARKYKYNYTRKLELCTIIVLCVFILIFYFFPFFENESKPYMLQIIDRIQLIKIPPTIQPLDKKKQKNHNSLFSVESVLIEIPDSVNIVTRVKPDSFYFSYPDMDMPWRDLNKFNPSDLNYLDSLKSKIAVYKQYLKQKPWLRNYNDYDFRDDQFYVPDQVAEYKVQEMGREINVLNISVNTTEVVNRWANFSNNNEKLTLDNILNCKENIYLVAILWQHNPLTLEQIYQIDIVKQKNSYKTLIKNLDILVTEGLMKKYHGAGDQKYYTAMYSKYELVDRINKFIIESKEEKNNKFEELSRILNQIILYN